MSGKIFFSKFKTNLVILIILFVISSCGRFTAIQPKAKETSDSTAKDSAMVKDSIIIKDSQRELLGYSKIFQFMDTTFDDSSTMKISSIWKTNPNYGNGYLDTLVLDMGYLGDTTRLIYNVSALIWGKPSQIDRLPDEKGNIYCFMQFLSGVTYGATSLIAYRQHKTGFQKISFRKGEDDLFTSYCEFIISIDKIIMSCVAWPSRGVDEDTDYLYTRNTETSYVKTKTEIKEDN